MISLYPSNMKIYILSASLFITPLYLFGEEVCFTSFSTRPHQSVVQTSELMNLESSVDAIGVMPDSYSQSGIGFLSLELTIPSELGGGTYIDAFSASMEDLNCATMEATFGGFAYSGIDFMLIDPTVLSFQSTIVQCDTGEGDYSLYGMITDSFCILVR